AWFEFSIETVFARAIINVSFDVGILIDNHDREWRVAKVTTMLPLRRNDGSEVGTDEMEGIIDRLTRAFGGITLEGPVRGRWIGKERAYDEQNLKAVIAMEDGQVPMAEAIVREIGRQLGQEVMYFEVSD